MEFNDRRADGSIKPRHVIEREQRKAKMMGSPFRIVSKGKGAAHVEGNLNPRTTGGGNDMGSHVSYAPDSHCSGLTRLGPMKATYSGHDSASDALQTLTGGYAGKPCAKCTEALQRLV